MKKLKIQNLSKQIICIIIILMLCNFIIPNYSYAVSANGGGSLLKVMAQFLCFIPDAVINCLQEMFISTDEIDDTATGEYKILYGPATIFSGEIPAFDINFINPKGEFKESVKLDEDSIVIGGGTTKYEITGSERNLYEENIYEIMDKLILSGQIKRKDGKLLKLKGEEPYLRQGEISEASMIKFEEMLNHLSVEYTNESTYEVCSTRGNNCR